MELLKAIDAFDPEAVKAQCREAGEQPTCLSCGGEYHVDVELVPTPLCHACAHELIDKLARKLVEIDDILATEQFMEKQGATVAERSYRVGWNDRAKDFRRRLSRELAPPPDHDPSDDGAADPRSAPGSSGPAPSATRTPDR